MNLLLNPAFDIGTGYDFWTWGTGSTLAVEGEARSLPYCAYLTATRVSNPLPPPPEITAQGQVDQDVNLQAGSLYAISAHVKALSSWGPAQITVAGEEVARIEAGGGADWTYLSGVYAPSATQAYGVALRALLGSGDGTGIWLFDDCEVKGVVMPRGMINAYKSLMTRLKTMNGAGGGYYYDLSSRVIPRYAEPGDMPSAKLPYVCLPMNDNGGYRAVEGSHVIATMRQDVVMFVPDTEKILDDDNAPIAALKAHDDIIRCIMPASGVEWNLGDRNIIDVRPVGKQIIAGTNDGPQWCGIRITLEIDCLFSRSDLGPSA